MKTKRLVLGTLQYAFLLMLLFLCIGPFYLMVVNATQLSFDISTRLNLFPGKALAINYKTMQSLVNIWNGFFNSLLIALPFTFCTGYFGALTAFGFAKYSMKHKEALFAIVLASMMIPAQLGIIGFYHLNLKLHLLNSYLPFILPGIANATTVFFLRGMIDSVPDSLMESARLEGCSEFGIYNRIVLPCVLPGVATMCIFNFVTNWNNYMGPLILMTKSERYTMPVMIAMIKGLYRTNYGAMYLAIAISVVPIIIVYCFMSKYIISGLTTGSNK